MNAVPVARKLPLTVDRTLSWAGAHHARTGRWPSCTDRHVLENKNEKWDNINRCQAHGYHGLPRRG